MLPTPWELISHDAALVADLVGCGGICEPYAGNEPCTSALPVLCLEPAGLPDPGLASGYYQGWSGGNLAISAPIQGCGLTSLAAANAICAAQFGPGWRIAEFHDGGGWSWWADGNIGAPPPAQFWTPINDQPANCWN